MVRRLEAKGFPQLWGWLFVTLTIDQDEFEGPEEAYEAGSDRIRRMVRALREVGYPIKRYFSKLELHENEWPHWHLGFDCRERIENGVLADAWGLGFVNVRRVKKERDFRYLFKYVSKGSADNIPDWVLDYPRRIRVFQTSVGFYGEPSKVHSKASDAAEERPVVTLRAKFVQWSTRGVIRARDVGYRGCAVDLRATYPEIFIDRVESGARALDAYHLTLSIDSIHKYVCPRLLMQKSSKPNRKPSRTWDHFRLVRSSSQPALFQLIAASS